MTRAIRLLIACAAAATSAAGAQATRLSALRGKVLADTSELPLRGAEVSIPGLHLSVLTDSTGAFRLVGIPAGMQVVFVRRLGYSPVRAVLTLPPGDTLESEFLLVPQTTRLPGVNVRGRATNPKLSEFERRRTAGFGNFITSEQLAKMENRQTVEVLATIPGPKTFRSNTTSAAWVAGGRTIAGQIYELDRMDRARGAPSNQCWAAVYVDGIPMFRAMRGEPLFDVNSIPPEQIAGIEFYNGPSQMPPEFNTSTNTCGVLVIWTR